MGRNLKRYLSALLVLVMVLTILPVSVRAEGCAHESLKSHGGTSEYVPLDGTYHTVLYHHYYICNDCGAGVWGETTSSKEYHDIFYLDNYCLDCGYRPGSTHTHSYQTSSTETKRVNLDATYHNVVTTTYTKCSCGASGNSTTSTVKEAHAFGAAVEVTSGTWKKTCSGCGATQTVAAPERPGTSETTPPETTPAEPVPGETVPPQTHVHAFRYGNPAHEHPHYTYGYCSCGVGNTKTTPQELTCCACSGKHIWGYPVRLDDGSYKQVCTKCDAIQTIVPSEDVELYYRVVDIITYRHKSAKAYQDFHDIDSAASSIWKTIAEQATDVLLDEDFVTKNETLEAIDKGVVGSVWDAVTEESWDEQQKEYWKTLMLEMLTSDFDADAIAAEQKTIMNGTDVLSEALKLIENVTGDEMDRLNEKAAEFGTQLDVFNSSIHEYITTIEGSDQTGGPKSKIDELIEELKKNQDTATDRAGDKEHVNTWMKNLGLVTKFVEAAVDGIGDGVLTYQYNKTIIELGKNIENIEILNGIYESAVESGNTNLANAADELIADIEKDMVNAINVLTSLAEGVVKTFIEFGIDVATEFIKERLEGTIELVFKEVSKFLDILSLGGTAMNAILGWGPAYDAAQQLMTINQMDATMNITQVLKEEDNPYMAELWGLLQVEGCKQAKVFLDEWKDANFIKLVDFGITDAGFPAVNRQLDIEAQFHVNMLGLTVSE